MEKKNTILLTVIAVATLLVAVVGATFAYFTATSSTGGSGGTATVQTATTGAVSITMSSVNVSNVLEYPGGYVVAAGLVTASDADETNDYNVTFQVNGTITNGTSTTLNWYLYEVSSEITTPVDKCTLQTTSGEGNTIQYSYDNTCELASEIANTTNAVAYGTVNQNGTGTVTYTGGSLDTASNTTVYYYLVVEYPDTGSSQDTDQGATITAQLTTLTNGTYSVIP